MIYLDNAATEKFKPVGVLNAVYYTALNSANPGRAGHSDGMAAAKIVWEARETLASYLNAGEDYQIVFSGGCTASLNAAILGLSPVHTVADSFSHNSVLRPLKYLETNRGCAFTAVDTLEESALNTAIRSDTELIAVNHVSNVNGRIADLKKICDIAHKARIPILIDAAQSLGKAELDLKELGADIVAGAGHKGLHGIQGVGFLAIKKGIRLNPVITGGTGTLSESLVQPLNLPESLESGTLNTPGIAGLKAAVEWTSKNALYIRTHIAKLSMLAHKLLAALPITVYSRYPSPIIAFNIKGMHSSEAADLLNERGIAVRGGLHCAPLAHMALGTLETGIVRASPGLNNTETDIVKLYEAVRTLAA